jgi:hypothetical protein
MPQKQQKKTKKEKNKETLIKLLFENHGHITNACQSANIDRATFYRWKREDKEFAAAIEESLIDYAKSKLMENITGNDTTSIIFFLKTKGKDQGFTERQEVRLTKPIDEINFEEI